MINKQCIFCQSTLLKKISHSSFLVKVPEGLVRSRSENFDGLQCSACKSIINSKNEIIDYKKGVYSANKNYTRKIIGYDYSGNLMSYLSKKNNNRILEIGAGEGAVATYLKNKNFNIDVVEPDINYKENLKKNNIDNVYKSLNSCKKKYDIIYSIGVLEHIHDLDKFILQCKAILKKNGLLIFQYPNIKSLSSRLFLKKWDMLFEPGHVSIPSVRGLSEYLKRFELIIHKSFSSTILTRGRIPFFPVRNYYMEKCYKSFTKIMFFKYINNILWRFIDFFDLGESIVVVIKKK